MIIPKNVKNILKQLNLSESQLADYCINEATQALKSGGYKDARLWATNILQNAIGELSTIKGSDEMEEWMAEFDGIERDVVEAIYTTFNYLFDSLTNPDPRDIKDTIVYSVSKTLDHEDMVKYKKSYG